MKTITTWTYLQYKSHGMLSIYTTLHLTLQPITAKVNGHSPDKDTDPTVQTKFRLIEFTLINVGSKISLLVYFSPKIGSIDMNGSLFIEKLIFVWPTFKFCGTSLPKPNLSTPWEIEVAIMIIIIIPGFFLYSAILSRSQRFHITDTVYITQCKLVAAAN